MIIHLKPPSFVFHAYDVSPTFYKMWRTVYGRPGTTVHELVSHILLAASLVPVLPNVVLNTHGFAGGMAIGGVRYTNTFKEDLAPFSMLANVQTIWLVSCNVANDTTGEAFCRTLAKTAKATVVASKNACVVRFWEGVGLMAENGVIDGFEGDAFAFFPDGAMKSASDPAALVPLMLDHSPFEWPLPGDDPMP